MVNGKERMKRREKKKNIYVTRGYRTILERHWKNSSLPRLRQECGFSTDSLFLSPSYDCSIESAPPVWYSQSGKETRASGNGAESAGHYLLLTIFMRLSIAEISTRRDDIDWHAVKPSDMRLRRSPPTPIRPSRVCVVLSRPILFLHCKRLTLYLHALPQPILKSHAPSISISPHPRRDCPPSRHPSCRKSALHAIAQALRRGWYRPIKLEI